MMWNADATFADTLIGSGGEPSLLSHFLKEEQLMDKDNEKDLVKLNGEELDSVSGGRRDGAMGGSGEFGMGFEFEIGDIVAWSEHPEFQEGYVKDREYDKYRKQNLYNVFFPRPAVSYSKIAESTLSLLKRGSV